MTMKVMKRRLSSAVLPGAISIANLHTRIVKTFLKRQRGVMLDFSQYIFNLYHAKYLLIYVREKK